MKLQAWLVPTLLALGMPLASPAQSTSNRPLADQIDEDETVHLSPFEVSSDRVSGYTVTDSMAARSRRPIIDTPTSIQVVTSEFMDDIGAGSILDATMYLSGVTVPVLGGVNGVQQRQTVRGFNIFGGTVDNFTTGTGVSSLEPAVVDRVEVIKGPHSILAPSGPPGGAANTITKSPIFDTPTHMFKAEVADQYFGSKGTLDSTGRIGDSNRFAYRVIGAYRDAKSYVPGRIQTKNINPMFTWAISEKTQLKFKSFITNWKQTGAQAANANNLYLADDFPIDGTVSSSPSDYRPGYVPFEANGASPYQVRQEQTRSATLELSSNLWDKVDLRVAALRQYRHYQDFGAGLGISRTYPANEKRRNPMTGKWTETLSWDLQDPSLPYDANTNPYVSTPIDYATLPYTASLGGGEVQHTWNHESHIQADAITKLDFGGTDTNPVFRLNIATGVSRQQWHGHVMRWSMPHEDVTAQFDPTLHFMNDAPLADPFNYTVPDWFATNGGWRGIWQNNGTIRASVTQVYLNTSFETFRGRLFGTFGSAQERRKSHNANYRAGFTWRDALTHTAPPSYALLYKINPSMSVYVAHAENSSQGSWWTGIDLGRQNIWQDGDQNEVGLKFLFFNQRLSITTSYFEIKKTNQAFADPRVADLPPNTPNPYPDFLFDISNEGLELDIAGQVTSNFNVLGSITKQKKRDHLGRKQANTQDDLFNLLLRYKFSSGALKSLGMHVGMNYAGSSVGENVAPDRTPLKVIYQSSFNLPARTLFNAGASYTLGAVSFQLNIDNLTDSKKPYVSGGRHAIGLAPPRNIRLTTTYRF